jgi:hypothetical protein
MDPHIEYLAINLTAFDEVRIMTIIFWMLWSSLQLILPPLFLVQDTGGYSMALFDIDRNGALTNVYS